MRVIPMEIINDQAVLQGMWERGWVLHALSGRPSRMIICAHAHIARGESKLLQIAHFKSGKPKS